MAVIGAGLVAWSRAFPVFTVSFDAAMRAYLKICPDIGGEYDHAASAHYSALFGWRYALANAGTSLFLGALTALIGLTALSFRSGQDDRSSLRTPTHRWQFLALGVLAILLLWLGLVWGLRTDLSRQYFPTCADSIAIPIIGTTITTIIVAPIMIFVGYMVTRKFGALPVPLTQWDQLNSRKSWTISAVFLTLAGLNIAILTSGILYSDIVLPAGVLTTYLLLATRAALLAHPQ